MDGSGLHLSKNEWERVVFVGKWLGVGQSGWERISVMPQTIVAFLSFRRFFKEILIFQRKYVN